MKSIIERPALVAAIAAIVLALASSPALAQGLTNTLTDQAKQRAMEEMQKRTGGTIPGQPAPPADQGTQAAPMAPTTAGGGGGKVLVWGDPANKTYYREGDAGYGSAAGGRCMIEKDAKESGLLAATKQKGN